MTSVPFVAVVRGDSASAVRPILLAAGAGLVLGWTDRTDRTDWAGRVGLEAASEPDETPVVLVDIRADEIDPGRLADDVTAALAAWAGYRDAVIATVRPVTDTLKLVDAESVVTGTAERDRHRFVGSPLAMSLQQLRALAEVETGSDPDALPDTVAVLKALIARGVVVRCGKRDVSARPGG